MTTPPADRPEAYTTAPTFFRSLVESSAEITAVIDEAGVIRYANPTTREVLGAGAGDPVGRSFLEYVHPEDLERVVASFEAAGGQPAFEGVDEVRVGAPRGGYRWMQSLGRRLTEGPAAGLYLLQLRDVTERRAAEEGLRAEERSAAFQALLLDSVGQAVVATDLEGRVLYWNRGAEALFGWSAEEALGGDIMMLVPEDVEQADAGSIMAALRQGESWSGEYTVLRKDGERIPVLLSNRPVVEGGEVVGVIGVSSDLREQKRLEERLRQGQKLEAVGQLAGGIAHDFNNILTAIGGYAGMAAERARDEQLAADIAEIVRAADRARALVNKLLAFSRRSRVIPRAVDLNRSVRELIPLLVRTIPAEVRVETVLAETLWPVRTDPSQIEQALLNLVVNARDAMPEGGTVTIRTDNVELGEEAAEGLEEPVPAGPYVRVVVEDTGTGMEEGVRARIFEPFFTTKEVGKGTGLGLSMVFGAVRQVGGGIQVQSRPGEGSRFALYLPRSGSGAPGPGEDAIGAGVGAAEAGAPGRSAAAILLVEDEPAVRRLARRILEREGYRVEEAETGRAALRRVEAGERFDLVVSDVIMPEMGGGELAERLRAIEPGIRFLFMSGYTADELEDRGIETTTAFLAKPFPPAALVEAAREALEAPEPGPPRQG